MAYKSYQQAASQQSEQPAKDSPATPVLSRLSKLLPYYLECIYEDGKPGASYFLSEEGKKFLVPPLKKEWSAADLGNISIPLGPERSNFAKTLRQQRGTSTLFYGYPLFVRWVEKSQKGWTGGFAVPVFLQALEFETRNNALECRISGEHIRINGVFLDQVFKTNEEKRAFLRDMCSTSAKMGHFDLKNPGSPTAKQLTNRKSF
ncbi:MAG: hypothetical protein AABZ44_02630 [Elusimicrobiota bacterium]